MAIFSHSFIFLLFLEIIMTKAKATKLQNCTPEKVHFDYDACFASCLFKINENWLKLLFEDTDFCGI